MNGTALHARTLGRLVALGVGLSLLSRASTSAADNVSPTGKGIVGGALLGGELIMAGEAAFGVKPAWAYLVGGVAGAAGGSVLGWVAEKEADSHVSVYMLAGGMALTIPVTVAILQASAYEPPGDYTEDRPPPGTPIPEPPQPSTAPPSSPAPAPNAPAPGSMVPSQGQSFAGVSALAPISAVRPVGSDVGSLYLHYHWSRPMLRPVSALLEKTDEGVRLSIPALEVRPLYSMLEVSKYGLTQQQELRLTLLSAVF